MEKTMTEAKLRGITFDELVTFFKQEYGIAEEWNRKYIDVSNAKALQSTEFKIRTETLQRKYDKLYAKLQATEVDREVQIQKAANAEARIMELESRGANG